MKARAFYFLLSIQSLFSLTSSGQLVINELMQSNIDCMMDNLNEFPDSWVELYNVGNVPVSLNQYGLGVTNDANEAWKMPDSLLMPACGSAY